MRGQFVLLLFAHLRLSILKTTFSVMCCLRPFLDCLRCIIFFVIFLSFPFISINMYFRFIKMVYECCSTCCKTHLLKVYFFTAFFKRAMSLFSFLITASYFARSRYCKILSCMSFCSTIGSRASTSQLVFPYC